MVQKNDGRRMTSNAANKLTGTSGAPINSTSISGQVELVADSYPYTFSLMVSAYEQGCEGTYTLTMYCDDHNVEVINNAEFDLWFIYFWRYLNNRQLCKVMRNIAFLSDRQYKIERKI